MPRKPIEIMHELMTSQLFILAVAIMISLLLIVLADPGKSQATSLRFWA